MTLLWYKTHMYLPWITCTQWAKIYSLLKQFTRPEKSKTLIRFIWKSSSPKNWTTRIQYSLWQNKVRNVPTLIAITRVSSWRVIDLPFIYFWRQSNVGTFQSKMDVNITFHIFRLFLRFSALCWGFNYFLEFIIQGGPIKR